MANDLYDLQRFLDAQAQIYDQVVRELRAGRKASHWMWFIFPQIAGLGFSAMTQRYSLRDRDEAAAYDAHPVLGARLRECTGLVIAVPGRSVHDIFGSPDDMKFRSSMTLFSRCTASPEVYRAALDRYFEGAEDARTVALL